MQILKPRWISHNGRPIFSIDIHPDGSRFATGGQGRDTGRVMIWNLAPVLDEEVETNENVPKMLCQIDSHFECVNCVRWSFSGKYLATGGDDKLVMIWAFAKAHGNNTIFGSKGAVNVETWKCVHTLRGHDGDILDIAWSPNDVWLASASVDNSVIVWNATSFPEIVTILKGHTCLVKGITWDPIGRYISTQSDDKTLRIWRTADWQTEITITEPFKLCSGSTEFLRHSWSPDGQYLLTSHAKNNEGPTSRIIERDGWKCVKDYVGHRKSVTCARFSDCILKRRCKKVMKNLRACVFALGSKDKSISVWLTCQMRPLVVVENIFDGPVLDLSWTLDGLNLLACSFDGSISCFRFNEKQIGKAISKEKRDALYEKIYGTSSIGKQSQLTIIENPELLRIASKSTKSENDFPAILKDSTNSKNESPNIPNATSEVKTEPLITTNNNEIQAEEKKKVDSDKAVAKDKNSSKDDLPLLKDVEVNSVSEKTCAIKPSPIVKTSPIASKQIETRTSDGRRRVTPILVSVLTNDVYDTPAPFKCNDIKLASSSSEEKSKILIEKRENAIEPNVASSNSSCNNNSSSPNKGSPMQIVDTNEKSSFPISNVESSFATSSVKSLLPTSTANSSLPISGAKISLPSSSKTVSQPSTKTESPVKPVVENCLNLVPIKRAKLTETRFPSTKKKATAAPVEEINEGKMNTECVEIFPSLRMENLTTIPVRGVGNLVINNDSSRSSKFSLSRIKLTSTPSDAVLWEHVFGCSITSYSLNNKLLAITLSNRNLYILNRESGAHLLPPMTLSGAASHITLSDCHLLCITNNGRISVWDLVELKSLLSDQSLSCILEISNDNAESIKKSAISKSGVPMLSLSNGKSYMFSYALKVWLLMGDCLDPVARNSALYIKQNSHRLDKENQSMPLHNLQSTFSPSIGKSGLGMLQNSEISSLCTLTYLEQQVTASLTLQSPIEYRHWLLAFVRFLLQRGDLRRLRIICDDLLGPTHQFTKPPGLILGMCKHSLLREILEEIAKNVNAQRLYIEFIDQLNTQK